MESHTNSPDKALRSKCKEVFCLFLMEFFFTTLDVKLFGDTATLLPGYIGTYIAAC